MVFISKLRIARVIITATCCDVTLGIGWPPVPWDDCLLVVSVEKRKAQSRPLVCFSAYYDAAFFGLFIVWQLARCFCFVAPSLAQMSWPCLALPVCLVPCAVGLCLFFILSEDIAYLGKHISLFTHQNPALFWRVRQICAFLGLSNQGSEAELATTPDKKNGNKRQTDAGI